MNASCREEGELKRLSVDELKEGMQVVVVSRTWGTETPEMHIGKIDKLRSWEGTITYEITVNGKLLYGQRDAPNSFSVYALPGSTGGSRKRKGSRRVTRRGTRRTKLL